MRGGGAQPRGSSCINNRTREGEHAEEAGEKARYSRSQGKEGMGTLGNADGRPGKMPETSGGFISMEVTEDLVRL